MKDHDEVVAGRIRHYVWPGRDLFPDVGNGCELKEKAKMAASACTMKYPAVKSQFRISGNSRGLRIADDAEETDKPVQAASLAEFAHDLCSPLNALAIAARCLRDEGPIDHQNQNIDTIIRISEHALGMLRDALNQARCDAGRDVARGEICDLHLMAGDVADVSRPSAQAKNLEFVLRRNPACPRHVYAEASRLRRVLINVLDNAVKYTTQGSVSLSLDFAESRDSERLWLIFEIRDTGIGIARKDRARIFEPFVRGSSVARTSGSGLGLTIACQLVHSMGGTIRVESTPGVGSSFRIEVPVVRAQEADGDLPSTTPPKPPLPLEDLAALPNELRAELRESLLALDVARVHAAIDRIAEHNATLGVMLESHANRYAFTGIFKQLELIGQPGYDPTSRENFNDGKSGEHVSFGDASERHLRPSGPCLPK